MAKIIIEKNKNGRYMPGGEPFFIKRSSDIGVLIIHGFTSTTNQCRQIADLLKEKDITVYAPLVAGHGTSPADLAKTTISDWKNSVQKAFNKIKKEVKKVIIIGNSFGGNLAFYLASKPKNNVSGVISLGTPLILRGQKFLKFRLYTYGWFKKYYRKATRLYKADYTDLADEVTYPIIPISSLRNFFYFIKYLTPLHLQKVKTPTLIIYATHDPIINSKSAQLIHEHLSSKDKRIIGVNCSDHAINGQPYQKMVLDKIYKFIEGLK